MHVKTAQEAPSDGGTPSRASSSSNVMQPGPEGFQKFLLLTLESLGLVKNVIDLAFLEVLVALQTIPKLIVASLSLIFILTLTWISFSLCLSWLAYRLFNDIGAGFFCFFFVQLAMAAVLLLMLRHYRTLFTLPNSRAQIKQVAEVFHDAFTASEAKKDGRGSANNDPTGSIKAR